MTTRGQKRRAIAELGSGEFETTETENIPSEDLIASSSKVARTAPENLYEIKTSLRKEIQADLTKILAENQKEMLKLIAPLNKKRPISANVQDSDSEPEDISVARTSTPVKTITATSFKTTPIISHNTCVPDTNYILINIGASSLYRIQSVTKRSCWFRAASRFQCLALTMKLSTFILQNTLTSRLPSEGKCFDLA